MNKHFNFNYENVLWATKKWMGSGWRDEPIDSMLNIFVHDYNETNKKIQLMDAQAWLIIENSALIRNNKSKNIKRYSINDYIHKNNRQTDSKLLTDEERLEFQEVERKLRHKRKWQV